MPIRHATLNHQLHQNGARLHVAMMMRIRSHGADDPPSAEELELLEERRKLKEARAERQAQALQPHAKALKLVRTTHAQPHAPKEKAEKAAKEAKAAKKAKPHMTRTEKHAQKAAALDAARRAAKKSATKT
ncbi:MAG TPA: hypothetical protein VGQ91_01165 [Ideonella sp.]|jgi:hypothetical protein|nr:hypothetical protein [Ideonella sp.]